MELPCPGHSHPRELSATRTLLGRVAKLADRKLLYRLRHRLSQKRVLLQPLRSAPLQAMTRRLGFFSLSRR